MGFIQTHSDHYMKRVISILFLFLGIYQTLGQSYSMGIDSLTKMYIEQLSTNTQKKFVNILNQRTSIDYFKRIDSIICDYTFIEEIYYETESAIHTYERYFFDSDSTIDKYYDTIHRYVNVPRYSYYNGLKYAAERGYFSKSVAGVFFDNVYEYYYTLDTLLANHINLKPIQELTYDPTLAIFDISDTSSTKKLQLESQLNLELLKTYKILSFIDHKQKKILVSIQLPPTDPKVEIRYVKTISYDW